MHPREQTIFALSSGRPPSAISIVRVSGPQAGAALTALAGTLPAPRMATRALLRDANQQPIDDAVILWFPGPASFTGEAMAELITEDAAHTVDLSPVDPRRFPPLDPARLRRPPPWEPGLRWFS